MLLERVALGCRIAEPEFQLRGGLDAAIGEIAARLGAGPRRKRRLEEFRRKFEHVVERLAALLARLGFLGELGDRNAGERGEPLHRLRERHALALHDEIEDVAVLARGEIVKEAFLVVDRERRGFFLVERREPDPFAAALPQFHPPPHDVRNRKPGAQFVEELGREAHELRTDSGT